MLKHGHGQVLHQVTEKLSYLFLFNVRVRQKKENGAEIKPLMLVVTAICMRDKLIIAAQQLATKETWIVAPKERPFGQ